MPIYRAETDRGRLPLDDPGRQQFIWKVHGVRDDCRTGKARKLYQGIRAL
jgi:hypothetical protein